MTRLWLTSDALDGPWDSLRVILQTISEFIPSINSTITFHRRITSDTLLTIRDALLLPLLSRTDSADAPSAIKNLARSVDIISKAVTFEESLTSAPRIIRDFAETRAGNVYVGARKSYVLKRVRDEVVGKWGKWQSVVVERERVVDLPSKAVEDKPIPVDKEEVEKVATLEEDGWAFDDAPSVPRPRIENATEDATPDADGWGFDDDDIGTTAPKDPPIVAPKPIRQARKIGKKSKSANTTSEDSGTASPAVESDRIPTPLTETSSVSKEKADGWDMEWEPEPVPVNVPSAVHERLKVSIVLDNVMAIVIDELQFVDAFQKAGYVRWSFVLPR